jgi:hypothetical protein
MQLIWRQWSIAEFPMTSFLSIRFSASVAGRTFILIASLHNKTCLLLKQKLQRGEVGEVDEGPNLQPYQFGN